MINTYTKKIPAIRNRIAGISSFEIPRLPFTRLLVEHKLYITLLLILTPLVHLHRVLAFSFPSALKDRAMGWLAWTINFLY